MSLVNPTLVEKVIYWLLNIILPTINAQAIVTYILSEKSKFCQIFIISDFTFFKPIGNDTMEWNWIVLILHIIISLLILIAMDCGFFKFRMNFSLERRRVLNLNHSITDKNLLNPANNEERYDTDHLIVHDLVKRFPGRNVCAVNHLVFGAKRGEAFGLLGYNGAGKTTTFRILVGDELAAEGTAYIDEQNVNRRLRSIRQLGYCPQENCNMNFLTIQDSSYLLARIRGVNFSRIYSLVQTISSLFLLDPFLKNYIHQLTGGTKRRLHAALALIGPPLVAILDEPTTNVDPNGRQQIQQILINAVKAKLTIILTSHSMDE
ncbi:unnamed protein product [Rotaria sp. Silwood1]|nr:unnamed protein product [Rotaria sp. Silwood1]CAF1642177.1 unnamed protein product [Rotaria sp. Silwood1]CAF3842510.1 unnamed protein product [Rotaria sp. Silwood1]CAF5006063.1 unnamed protein product [Rotaria sp. Silwood1]